MAPRRLSENLQPPASSYDEEESESESETETESESKTENREPNGAVDKEDDDDADEDEEEEDEDEEEGKESPVLKKSAVAATPQKSDSATDSDDSESTQPSPSLSAFTIKLHNRSPKPKSNRSGSKRPAQPDSIATPTNKKTKPTGDDEEVKKGTIQRLWSEDDEIAVLNGLTQYKSEKGTDPYLDMGAFHEFIKKSLHVDVTKNQLYDKIRRLKKKYRDNVERAENGKGPVFARQHDQKSFKLSEKVWGGSAADNTDKSAKKSTKLNSSSNGEFGGVTLGLACQSNKEVNQLSSKKPIRAPIVEERGKVKSKELNVEDKGKVNSKEANTEENMEENTENVVDFWRNYPSLSESLEIAAGLSDGVKIVLREQLEMLEKGKLKQLEDRWKKLKQAELELFVQRMELVQDQVKWALDSIKSGGS